MKTKLLFFLFTLLTSSIVFGQLNEGFESWPPNGWTIVQGPCSPTNDIIQYDGQSHGGSYSARFCSYNTCTSGYDEYLITPLLITTSGDQTLTFWYKKYYGTEVFKVGWSSTGTNVNTDFTWGTEISNATTSWQQYSKTDLPVGTKYVAIHYYSDYQYYLYIDDVVGPALAPCFILTPDETKDYGECPLNNHSPEYYTQTYTITNAGGGAVTVNSTTLTGGDSTEFVLTDTNTYPAILTNAQTISFDVLFDPTSIGYKSTTLHITTADTADPNHDDTLQGTAYVAPPNILEISRNGITPSADLNWQIPLPEGEIRYDDGTAEGLYRVNSPSNTSDYFYTKFNASITGTLNYIAIYNAASAGNDWNHIYICPDDGTGKPDLSNPAVTFSGTTVGPPYNTLIWNLLKLPTPISMTLNEVFYIVTQWPQGNSDGPNVGTDFNNLSGRSAWSSNSGNTWNIMPANNIFRAYISRNTSRATMELTAGSPVTGSEKLPVINLLNKEKKTILSQKQLSLPVPGIYTKNTNTSRSFMSYTVHRGDSTGVYNQTFTGIGGTSFSDTTITPATTYYYTVTGVYSNSDTSDFSNETEITTFSECPEPTNLTELSPNDTTTDISWKENGISTQWEIMLDTAGYDTIGYTHSPVTNNPYLITGLSENTSYDWYVRANCGDTIYSPWAGPKNFSTFPFVENFENTVPPDGWTEKRTPSNSPYGWQSWSSGYNGKCATFSISYTQNNVKAELITPLLDLSGLTTAQLRFYYKKPDGGYFRIKISTDGGTTYTIIKSLFIKYWNEKSIDISSYIGSNVKIDFEAESSSGNSYLYIDSVVVEEIPACIPPTTLYYAQYTATTANLYWSKVTGSSGYNWKVVEAETGLLIANGSTYSGNDTTATATGLSGHTKYHYYVQNGCGGNWAGPKYFRTFVEPNLISSFPYSESFESGFGDWKQMYWDNFDWIRSTHIYSSCTGPSAAYDSSYFIYTNASGYNYPNKTDKLLLSFDFSSLTLPQLTFAYHMYGTNMGTLKFEASIDNGLTWDTIWIKSGDQGNQWFTDTVMMNSYSGDSNVQIKIQGTTGHYKCSDMAVDMITITEGPDCPHPTNQQEHQVISSSAMLEWLENGFSSTWEIMLDTTGFDTTGAVHTPVTTDPYTQTGLTTSTTYDWYTRSICGGGDTSRWVGPKTFTTTCTSDTTPWSEGFEGMSAVGSGIVPDCMAEDGDWTTSNAPQYCNRQARTGTNYIYTESSADDWLFSSPIELTAGTTYDFSFWYITGGREWTTLEASFGRGQSADEMTTPIGTPVSDVTNTSYTEYRGSFTPSVTGTYYTGIHVVATGLPCYMSFDDLLVEEKSTPPLCTTAISPTDGAMNVAASGNLEWDEITDATGYKIWFGSDGAGSTDPANIENGTDLGNVQSYTYSNLSADTYFWKIVPYSANGDATGCSIWSFNTGDLICSETASETGKDDDPVVTTISSFGCTGGGTITSMILDANIGGDCPDYYSYDIIVNGTTIETHQCNQTGYNLTSYLPVTSVSLQSNDEDEYSDEMTLALTLHISYKQASCAMPTNQNESNITSSSANLDWTENGSATTWEIIIDTTGFNTTGYTPSITTSNSPYFIAGLSANTSYDWYVRTICSAGDTSIWTGPGSFTTECSTITTFPYCEGFINSVIPDCWNEEMVNRGSEMIPAWTYDSTGTLPTSTPYTGAFMAKFNSYNCSSGAQSRLYTCKLNFSNMTNMAMSFWMYHDPGHKAYLLEGIQIQVSTDGTTWADAGLLNKRTSDSSGWSKHTVDLSAYDGEPEVYIGFLGVSQWGNNVFLDSITIHNAVPETATWTGNTNYIWYDTSNWTTADIPYPTTDVTIPVGLTNYPTIGKTGAQCNNLKIESNSSGDASLIGAGYITINGIDTIERYIASNSVWHEVSAMTTAATIGSFYFNHNPDVWMQEYVENSDSRTSVWDLATNMPLGKGFEIWVDTGFSITAVYTGTINDNDVALTTASVPPLSFTNSSFGYNLLGNPFTSAISWDSIFTYGTPANIDNEVWVWDPSSGNYKTYTGAGGTLTDGIIPMGQGFFIHANAVSPALTIPTVAQVHSSQAFYAPSRDSKNNLMITVNKGNRNDAVIIAFDPEYSDEFESGLDGRKIMGSKKAPQLYIVEDGEELSIDALPPVEAGGNKVLKLFFKAGVTGEQVLITENLDNLPGMEVFLEDLKLDVIQSLNENPVYAFNATYYQNPDRFRLHFERGVNGIDAPTDDEVIRAYSNNKRLYIVSNGDIANKVKLLSLYDLTGRKILEKQLPPGELVYVPVNLSNAYVVVRIISNGEVYTTKVFIK